MTIPAETVKTARDRGIAEVAIALGASRRILEGRERGVPCPGCGGDDRFAIDPGKNVFLCRKSGAAGDPIALVRHVHGVSFAEAVAMLAGDASMPERRAPQRRGDDRYRQRARERAHRIWTESRSIEPARGGHLVVRYLAARGIPLPAWRVRTLRETEDLPYWHWSKERQEFVRVHSGPAMLAAITGPDGRFIGVHRTWIDLSRPGGKAEIFDPDTGEMLAAKKVEGSQRGGRIVLREADGGELAIGEGNETVLSWAAINPERRCGLWCGINLDNIAGRAADRIDHPSLTVTDSLGRVRRVRIAGPTPDPEDRDCLQVTAADADRIILLGDGDSDRFTTQAAMTRAERRMAAFAARTEWAPDGSDWNDVLRARKRERAA